MTDRNQLIHDWNTVDCAQRVADKPVLLDDETLRDGLQSPTVNDPTIDEKIRLLHLMHQLGIDMVDLGLPGAGPRACADVEALAERVIVINRGSLLYDGPLQGLVDRYAPYKIITLQLDRDLTG